MLIMTLHHLFPIMSIATLYYLLATAEGDVRISEDSGSVHLEDMMQATQQEQGSLFQQALLIYRNKSVVDEKWRYNKSNIQSCL